MIRNWDISNTKNKPLWHLMVKKGNQSNTKLVLYILKINEGKWKECFAFLMFNIFFIFNMNCNLIQLVFSKHSKDIQHYHAIAIWHYQ